jgi:FHA domain
MLRSDRHTAAVAPRDDGSNPVHLRLRTSGELLELPRGKTTVGSSPRCNLRIQHPGVHPLHCLIVHGPDGLSVRRWATDTHLNGLPFDDAPLAAGDCLLLGSVELELLKSPSTSETGGTSNECEFASTEHCNELMDVVQDSVDAITSIEDAACEPTSTDSAREFEPSPARAEPVQEAAATATDAADVVFRELQAACAISRGRSRKILAAFRAQREQNQDLLQRLAVADEQLAEQNWQRTSWDSMYGIPDGELCAWQQEVQELRLQIGEFENSLAEHSRRMSELQQELAVARLSPASVLAPVNPANSERAFGEPARGIETVGSVGIRPPMAEPWTNASHTAKSVERLRESEDVDDSPNEEAGIGLWSSPAQPSSSWADSPVESTVPGGTAHRASHWQALELAEEPADADVFGASSNAEMIRADELARASGTAGTSASEPGHDALPLAVAESPIWRHSAISEQPGVDVQERTREEPPGAPSAVWGTGGPFNDEIGESDFGAPAGDSAPISADSANPWATAVAEPAAEGFETASPKAPPTSFIERYSHLFDENASDERTLESASPPPPAAEPALPKARTVGVVDSGNAPAPSAVIADEESIEQYMAKLLQRVRGDSPYVPSSQGVTINAPAKEVAAAIESSPVKPYVTAPTEHSQSDADEPESDEEAARAMVNWEDIARRAAATAPTTDLGPLRALANETARRAIGRHGLKLHRRKALTKVIVSTLAGMTSLWLMLDAPHWRDLQFIAACVLLVAAAYWAGEAFRAMRQSLRAAAYDGPAALNEYASDGTQAGLPIDVEQP